MYLTKYKVRFLVKKESFALLSLRGNVKRSDILKKLATHPLKITSFEIAAVQALKLRHLKENK